MRQGILSGYIIPALTVLFFLSLIGLTIFTVRHKTKQFSGEAMVNDIFHLANVFERINKDCTILSFDYQKNNINFLNVESFTGSEVGPMNLAYPDKWNGPYMEDNPTIQGKEYQIVRTTDAGYFIVPGNGVELPNGKVMGKDIILHEDDNIATLAHDPDYLSFNGKPLAQKLNLSTEVSLPDLQKTPLPEF